MVLRPPGGEDRLLRSSEDGAPIGEGAKPLLVCFSHLRWNFVMQRPQHLLTRAARWADVLFVEEPLFGAAHDAIDVAERDGVRVAVPHLVDGRSHEAVTTALAHLVEALLAQDRAPRVLWYYTPAAVAFTRTLPRSLTIYDNMDELSAFHGASRDLLDLERALLEAADLVFTGGWSLHEAKRSRHRAVHCFPSSVDAAHFSRARDGHQPDPPDQAPLPRPRLGFFGVIDERMDMAFLAGFAALRPDWHFVMLGPVVKIDPASLPRAPNIHWLGMKAYAELPGYMARWDLAFMPFALNEATRFISPTKTPEFLAGGLPVVSTAVPDVVRAYGGDEGFVTIVASPPDAALAATTMMAGAGPDWLARVDARLAAGSWDETWAGMRALIEVALVRRAGPAARAVEPADPAGVDA